MKLAKEICLRLLMQPIDLDLALAELKAGKIRLARMAIMAITTSSSMRVKPYRNLARCGVIA
jgi:hypothetical protein